MRFWQHAQDEKALTEKELRETEKRGTKKARQNRSANLTMQQKTDTIKSAKGKRKGEDRYGQQAHAVHPAGRYLSLQHRQRAESLAQLRLPLHPRDRAPPLPRLGSQRAGRQSGWRFQRLGSLCHAHGARRGRRLGRFRRKHRPRRSLQVRRHAAERLYRAEIRSLCRLGPERQSERLDGLRRTLRLTPAPGRAFPTSGRSTATSRTCWRITAWRWAIRTSS